LYEIFINTEANGEANKVFKYLQGSGVKDNNLKKVRVNLGLTITELSRYANVSSKVISQTERGLIDPTLVTKNKIINGLNMAGASTPKKWEFSDIFPYEES
jgi:DNA-binding XRE family transcriptional regulator